VNSILKLANAATTTFVTENEAFAGNPGAHMMALFAHHPPPVLGVKRICSKFLGRAVAVLLLLSSCPPVACSTSAGSPGCGVIFSCAFYWGRN